MNVALRLFALIITVFLAACGGGGDGGAAFFVPQQASSKTTAVLKIATQRVSGAEEQLTGVGITVTLPKGVTVTTNNGTVAATSVFASGVAQGRSVLTTYTETTATANATLQLIVNAGGTLFGTGEFVTVTCNLPAGNSLQSSDFSPAILSNFAPSNAQLQPAAGLVPVIAATLL
jgi:hypothetical protein